MRTRGVLRVQYDMGDDTRLGRDETKWPLRQTWVFGHETCPLGTDAAAADGNQTERSARVARVKHWQKHKISFYSFSFFFYAAILL